MVDSTAKTIKSILAILLFIMIAESASRGQSPSPSLEKFLVCDSIEIRATLPVALEKKLPEYPRLARDYRIEGKVELVAVIFENGTVGDIRVLHGNPVLAEAARKATLGWKFRAGLEGGLTVKSEFPVTYNFKIQ